MMKDEVLIDKKLKILTRKSAISFENIPLKSADKSTQRKVALKEAIIESSQNYQERFRLLAGLHHWEEVIIDE